MKRCRTIKGLSNSLKKGEVATLKVWDIMTNHFDKYGAYLNLGGGAYAYVGEQEWKTIRNHLVDPDGTYYKDIPKYKLYFEGKNPST